MSKTGRWWRSVAFGLAMAAFAAIASGCYQSHLPAQDSGASDAGDAGAR
jgi:hypothetical protein